MRKLAAALSLGGIGLGALSAGLLGDGTHERAGAILLAVAGAMFIAGTLLALATDANNP